jgi:hypothetical protein
MMKPGVSKVFLWFAVVFLAVWFSGCANTRVFGYRHPRNSHRTLMVSLSYNLPSRDVFRVIIDGGLIFQKKLTIEPQETIGWAVATGWFEGDPVILSCSRDAGSVATTWCDFSIGTGEHVKIKII